MVIKRNKEFVNSKLLSRPKTGPNIKLCLKKIAHHATVYLYTMSLDWSGSEIYHVRKKWNPFQLRCRTFLLSLIYAYGFQAKWGQNDFEFAIKLLYPHHFTRIYQKKSRAESVWISKALICKLFWRPPKKYEIEGADCSSLVCFNFSGRNFSDESSWIKLIFVIRINT